MKIKFRHFSFTLFCFSLTALLFSGCGTSEHTQGLERLSKEQAATIQSLHKELSRLNKEIDDLMASRDELGAAKSKMEKDLGREVSAGNLSIDMQEKGLVVTVLDRVLFDPGRADLKAESFDALAKVAEPLSTSLKDHIIYIEGHTDDQPIRYSGWRSNWELSIARAMEVLHYFVDEKGMDPRRFAATGFGEFHPVVSNDTPENQMKNRRVEIVISPKTLANENGNA